jgi:hypothetical protein
MKSHDIRAGNSEAAHLKELRARTHDRAARAPDTKSHPRQPLRVEGALRHVRLAEQIELGSVGIHAETSSLRCCASTIISATFL